MGQFDYHIPPDLEAVTRRQHRTSDMDPLVKAIVGVFVVAAGVYLGNLLYAKYLIYEANKAAQEFTARLQADMQAQAERARQHQLAIEHKRTLRRQMEFQYQQEQAARQAAALEASRLKEAAWNRYYKKPGKCSLPQQSEGLIVECGNHYASERVKFEQSWATRQDRLTIQQPKTPRT